MNKIFLPFFITTLLFVQIYGQSLKHYSQRWNAEQLFEMSTSQNLMISPKGILLNDQILVEDDAPASGYSSNPGALEVVKEGILLKKILKIERLPVKEAYIAALLYPDFPPEPNNGRHVVFNINGHDINYEVNHFWTKVPVPVEYFKTGDNIITLRTLETDTRFKTWVALDENYKYGSSNRLHAPERSFKSTDEGNTWNKNLGINNNVSGEYSIRLKLVGYPSEGILLSSIIDLAANSNIDKVLKQPVQINSIYFDLDKYESYRSHIKIEFRTGFTSNISDSSWTNWKQYSTGEINSSDIRGRFLQVKFIFNSDSRITSPILKRLIVKSSYKISPSIDPQTIHVLSSKNYPIINSSFSFEYENPKLPKLVEFRKKYNLDKIVAGAKTEFEKMLKLKTWVAKQWKWHLLKPNVDLMAWNADKILTPDSVGEKGGFCADYAIVFMQALQSFGIPARFVIMNYSVWGGHEIVEAWSNDYGKWVLLDPNFDTYFANPKTEIPYNALELHEIFLKEYYPNEKIDRDNWSRKSFVKKAKKIGKNVPVICKIGGGANGGNLKQYQWWEPTVELYAYSPGLGFLNAGFLRYMPRNNFLTKPYPIPVNEGRTHWAWTGYYCWYDSQTPPTVEHKIFTSRDKDLYWNLNEVEFSASLKDNDHLIIEMRTNTPYLDHYEIILNGEKTSTKENFFEATLIRGVNQIKMRIIDIMGNKGPVSYLKLNYF